MEALCFQQYATDLAMARFGSTDSKALFNISVETNLLVEIRDIRDELAILQMVLTDQQKTLEEFSQVVSLGNDSESEATGLTPGTHSSLITHNKVLESHLYRVEKMDKLAEKTYNSVRNDQRTPSCPHVLTCILAQPPP